MSVSFYKENDMHSSWIKPLKVSIDMQIHQNQYLLQKIISQQNEKRVAHTNVYDDSTDKQNV